MANLSLRQMLLPIVAIGLAGCSTSVVSDDPSLPDQTETSKVYFRVAQNEFTRADESETQINTLHLAFYSPDATGPNLKYFLKATREINGTYSAELKLTPGDYPDIVVAFANFSDDEAMKSEMQSAISSNPSTLSDLGSAGNLAMSSTRYFDSDGNDIYYTPLSPKNFISASPVGITLERVAAKVTLTKTDGFSSSVTKGGKTLTLMLDKWSVNATDKESHIIKQIGTDFKNPLTGWTNWNNSTDKTMHWANSVNHDSSADLFPKYSDNLADAITSHVAYSDISNAFPSSVYAHESTRPKSLFNTPNALPSAVIAGHYLIDGATATFYKYGDQIFSTDEYWEAIAKAQEALFNLDGSKPDANDLKGILTDITPSKEIAEEDIANNLVTPQITTISNIIAFYDADKNQLDATDVTNVNKKLYKPCRLMEKFTDGKCVFSIPIKHMGPEGEEGFYGLVRNHHYNITLKSITGIGSGIADPSLPVIDQPESTASDSYQIGFSITVNEWTEVSQEIEIKE
ncbi:MAG: fimbria major subunit [Muribaculaceae bacterium]